jgi:hypothetical protein
LSSSASKRKSEHAGSVNKQQKTKDIRKLQNGSAFGVEVSQVILGEDSSGIDENEIQGMNTFQKNMLEFCAFSSKQASATNTILTS